MCKLSSCPVEMTAWQSHYLLVKTLRCHEIPHRAGSRYYRALESVSIASALSSALTIYPCQIRVNQTLTVNSNSYSSVDSGSLSASYTRGDINLEELDTGCCFLLSSRLIYCQHIPYTAIRHARRVTGRFAPSSVRPLHFNVSCLFS